MEKYLKPTNIKDELVKEVRESRLAIYNNGTLEELRNLIKYCFPLETYRIGGGEKYYYKRITHHTIIKYIGFNDITPLPSLSVKEFYMKEEFPKDDFGVIVENNNGKEIVKFLISKGFSNYKNNTGAAYDGQYYYIKNENIIDFCPTLKNPTSKTFTLEQLKQLDSNMETKKIRNYIVKKKCWGIRGREWKEGDILYATNADSLPYFKEIGLIDNSDYFTPVYEPEKPKEVIVDMGSFELRATTDGIFHKQTENITDFVKSMIELFKKDDFNLGYKVNVKEIIFSKTGCRNTKTTFSQWKKVWEEYQKIKE